MGCEKINILLSDFLDGALKPDLQARVQVHLKDCPSCRAELEGLRKTVQLLGRFETRRLPSDFNARLFQRLDAEVTSGKRPISAPGTAGWLGWITHSRHLWSLPVRLATVAAMAAVGLAGWELHPTQAPLPAVDRSYLEACVQVHDTLNSLPPSPHFTTSAALPDANLANEETD